MATVEFYSKAQVDAKIPSAAQLVPTTSGATSGDVLTFDGSDVGWAAAGGGGLPDPASASAGDVLTLDANKDAIWQTPSGGGGTVITAMNKTIFTDWVANMKYGDTIEGVLTFKGTNNHFYTIDGNLKVTELASDTGGAQTAVKHFRGIGLLYDYDTIDDSYQARVMFGFGVSGNNIVFDVLYKGATGNYVTPSTISMSMITTNDAVILNGRATHYA